MPKKKNTVCFGAPLHGEVLPKLQWVEVSTTFQIPSFQIIGLPSPEVAEARDRVRSAIEAIPEKFPRSRVVMNLSPASVRKRGTGSDLAMALAILCACAPPECALPDRIVAWGELGLNGRVKPLGQLTRSIFASWQAGVSVLLISREELGLAQDSLALLTEARAEKGSFENQSFSGEPPALVGVSDLAEAWALIRSGKLLERSRLEKDLVRQQACAARAISTQEISKGLLPLAPALERIVGVAATGDHHLLLLGPKGTGKSHALDWLIALQEKVSSSVRLQAVLLEEMAGRKGEGQQGGAHLSGRPVRKVGSQVKVAALVGCVNPGGIRVGEFSLADGGLLIADELPEWARDSREALREPLERGWVSLSRAHGAVEMPARFRLAANGNLCPCGGWAQGLGEGREEGGAAIFTASVCQCPPRVRGNYLARLSGPILDRVDLLYISYGKTSSRAGNPDALEERTERGREISRSNWGKLAGLLNAEEVESLLRENPKWKERLSRISVSSLRGRHKVLRNTLSIAAFDGAKDPGEAHFFEASCYRPERYGFA